MGKMCGGMVNVKSFQQTENFRKSLLTSYVLESLLQHDLRIGNNLTVQQYRMLVK